MTSVGIILYGPPASGKSTITRHLTQLDPTIRVFRKLKTGGKTTDEYRPSTEAHIDALRSAGEIVWENERYGSRYVIDRSGLDAALAAGTPVVHLGQPADIIGTRRSPPAPNVAGLSRDGCAPSLQLPYSAHRCSPGDSLERLLQCASDAPLSRYRWLWQLPSDPSCSLNQRLQFRPMSTTSALSPTRYTPRIRFLQQPRSQRLTPHRPMRSLPPTTTKPQVPPTSLAGIGSTGGTASTDYVYKSTWWALELQRCSNTTGACTTTDRRQVVLKQYVYGNTSHRWLITPVLTRKFGSRSPSFSYALYCGVNISLASDVICYQGSPDHSSSGAFNPGEEFNRSFGNATNRVYPMLRVTALWPSTSGATSSAKFRGWDVCNKSSGVKLCATHA